METITTKNKKLWYSVFGGRYTGDQPSFYDVKDLPWVPLLEENWEVMRDELLALIEEEPKRLQPYFINKKMSFPPKKWKTMGLYYWKITMHKNCDKCPKTVAIIKSIPGLTSFSVSVLEAESNINPHQGDTDAIYRCHIGVSIPDDLPNCGFQVGKEVRPWKEGKVLPFCDAQMHTAWNNTKERRIIIILDVMRPEYVKHQNSICAHVLASSVVQMLYQRFSFLSGKSGRLKYFLYHTSRIAILGILPIQRKFKR
jgi:aspartyl/asparaginyl beta-hydroxylase (cupin superfamily)